MTDSSRYNNFINPVPDTRELHQTRELRQTREKIENLTIESSPIIKEFFQIYKETIADSQTFTPSIQFQWCECLIRVSQDDEFISNYTINGDHLNQALSPKQKIQNSTIIIEHSMKVISKLIRLKYSPAYYLMGCLYSHKYDGLQITFLDRDDIKALKYYELGARLQNPQCCYRAGICYEYGKGCVKDINKAMQYYKMGASDECDNNSDCMYRLGIITLQSPLGDVNEAIHFFIRAESLGSSHSCFELGKIYEFDSLNIDLQDRLKQVGIERDPSRALTYYYKCASGYDYSLAQWKLGHCYEHGLLGLRVHALKSLGWYYKSVQHSLPNTMGLLGIAGWYLTGIPGVLQPDRQEALQWFHKVLLQPNASPVVKKRALFAQTLVQDTLAV